MTDCGSAWKTTGVASRRAGSAGASNVVGCWVVVLRGGAAEPARAQFSFDARRAGMGGVSLARDGTLRRYNPAYRAVPDHRGGGRAKLTIPIPLGLLQALKDSAAFDVHASYFNAVELANKVLNPPLYLEVKKAPIPSNDVTFTVGRNALVVDLGKAQRLVPTDEIGFGSSSRFLDLGITIHGVHAGVLAFLQEDVGFTLGDTLRDFLRKADSARVRTRAESALRRKSRRVSPSVNPRSEEHTSE